MAIGGLRAKNPDSGIMKAMPQRVQACVCDLPVHPNARMFLWVSELDSTRIDMEDFDDDDDRMFGRATS